MISRTLLLIIFSLLLFSTVLSTEIIKKNNGEGIILYDNKTWENLNDSFNKQEFNKKVRITNLHIKGKKNNRRKIYGKIYNDTNKNIEEIVYKIKIYWNNEYVTRKIFSIKNLESKTEQSFSTSINVEDIKGRDIIFELYKY